MAPRVSVVVPAFNNADYLAATMRSVLAQTFTDTEVVVADHASVDHTWDVLQEFTSDARVRLLRTPAGGGARRNWDAVTAEATGELVKLVCGDDLLHPECLQVQVQALDDHPSAAMAAATRDVVDAAGRPVVRDRGLGGLRGLVDGREAVRATVRSGTNLFGEPACVLVRREALLAAGGWDDTYPYLIDQQTYTHVLLSGDLVALRRSLASFRVSASQWSVRLARQQASQTRAAHAALAAAEPGLLTRADLVRGGVMAGANAALRRAAYLYLRRRMGAAPAGS